MPLSTSCLIDSLNLHTFRHRHHHNRRERLPLLLSRQRGPPHAVGQDAQSLPTARAQDPAHRDGLAQQWCDDPCVRVHALRLDGRQAVALTRNTTTITRIKQGAQTSRGRRRRRDRGSGTTTTTSSGPATMPARARRPPRRFTTPTLTAARRPRPPTMSSEFWLASCSWIVISHDPDPDFPHPPSIPPHTGGSASLGPMARPSTRWRTGSAPPRCGSRRRRRPRSVRPQRGPSRRLQMWLRRRKRPRRRRWRRMVQSKVPSINLSLDFVFDMIGLEELRTLSARAYASLGPARSGLER